MYKTIWNYISKHSKKSSTASVFLPVLVLEWTVLGLFAGALICLFLHNTTALVKATIVLCSGGYAGLIFGFLGASSISTKMPQVFLIPPLVYTTIRIHT